MAHFYKSETKNHLITSQIEHKCVLDSFRNLEDQGFEVTYLPVNKKGLVEVEDFKKSIKKATIGASIIMVNNEINTI